MIKVIRMDRWDRFSERELSALLEALEEYVDGYHQRADQPTTGNLQREIEEELVRRRDKSKR